MCVCVGGEQLANFHSVLMLAFSLDSAGVVSQERGLIFRGGYKYLGVAISQAIERRTGRDRGNTRRM